MIGGTTVCHSDNRLPHRESFERRVHFRFEPRRPLDRKLEIPVVALIHRHIPLKVDDAWSGKRIDPQAAGQSQLSFGGRPFSRSFPPLTVGPDAQARIITLHERRSLRVPYPMVSGLRRNIGLGGWKLSQQRKP